MPLLKILPFFNVSFLIACAWAAIHVFSIKKRERSQGQDGVKIDNLPPRSRSVLWFTTAVLARLLSSALVFFATSDFDVLVVNEWSFNIGVLLVLPYLTLGCLVNLALYFLVAEEATLAGTFINVLFPFEVFSVSSSSSYALYVILSATLQNVVHLLMWTSVLVFCWGCTTKFVLSSALYYLPVLVIVWVIHVLLSLVMFTLQKKQRKIMNSAISPGNEDVMTSSSSTTKL